MKKLVIATVIALSSPSISAGEYWNFCGNAVKSCDSSSAPYLRFSNSNDGHYFFAMLEGFEDENNICERLMNRKPKSYEQFDIDVGINKVNHKYVKMTATCTASGRLFNSGNKEPTWELAISATTDKGGLFMASELGKGWNLNIKFSNHPLSELGKIVIYSEGFKSFHDFLQRDAKARKDAL